MICPRCEGQMYDVGSCTPCGNLGYLNARGERIEGDACEPWQFVQDESDFRDSEARALNARNELVFRGRPRDVALAVSAVNASCASNSQAVSADD